MTTVTRFAVVHEDMILTPDSYAIQPRYTHTTEERARRFADLYNARYEPTAYVIAVQVDAAEAARVEEERATYKGEHP
jgi:hypothetical protein